jgi:two-component system response regulator FixJ
MKAARPLVFVVDDDQAVRDSLKFALELEGLDVLTCLGGPQLLAHGRLSDAACLVIDFQMPVMDGFELVEALRQRGHPTPVILITGEVTSRLRRRARAAGVRHVVEKPLLDSVLLETLQSLLSANP